jgi:DnaJ-class molecular chaperone
MAMEIENEEIIEERKCLIPHCCPVCGGNGLVPNGFYDQTSGVWSSTDITPETCRACGGTGIIWGKQ